MKKIVYIFLFLLSNLYVSVSTAACVRADLSSVWRIYTEHDSGAMRCTLVMPTSGTTIASNSYCYIPGVTSSTPMSGSLSLDPTNCHVYGSIKIGKDSARSVDAWISKGKDSMSGMSWKPSTPTDGGDFSGVKQF